MAWSGPLLTESQWKKIAPLLPETAQESPWWPPVDRQPPCPGRDSCGFCERCSHGRIARGVSATLDLLATAARWRSRHLAESLARISGRTQRTKTVQWSESFLDREFCSAKKGALESEKPSGQGDEVDGGGRRPRSSLGRLPSLCIPGGSPARGNTLATIRVGRRHRAGRPRQKTVG